MKKRFSCYWTRWRNFIYCLTDLQSTLRSNPLWEFCTCGFMVSIQ